MTTKIYFKHTMSCLPDLGMKVDIDEARREVRLTMDAFDSYLVSVAVTRYLPEEHGVVAFRDDNQKDMVWLTKRAQYELLVRIAGTDYSAQVVKLFDCNEIAVSLLPI